MAMAGTDRSEDRATALPRHAEPFQQLLHGDVVRDEQPITVERDGEVPVADLEGDANRLVSRSRRHEQDGLLRRLDDDVVVGADVEPGPRRQRGAGRQCQRALPPVRGLDPPPPPSALFRGEDEPIAIERCELLLTNVLLALGDDRDDTHQKRKYRCAIGSTRAGSHVSRASSARTSYVSASTSIRGSASLWIMSRLPIVRQCETATARRVRPRRRGTPASSAALDTNVTDVEPSARAYAANSGR